MASSTANWHWKNKNVTKWGKEWLETELVGIEVKGDGEEVVRIAKLVECDGDMELGQRKSKSVYPSKCYI
jgi:activator of HSP90 ATPase